MKRGVLRICGKNSQRSASRTIIAEIWRKRPQFDKTTKKFILFFFLSARISHRSSIYVFSVRKNARILRFSQRENLSFCLWQLRRSISDLSFFRREKSLFLAKPRKPLLSWSIEIHGTFVFFQLKNNFGFLTSYFCTENGNTPLIFQDLKKIFCGALHFRVPAVL